MCSVSLRDIFIMAKFKRLTCVLYKREHVLFSNKAPLFTILVLTNNIINLQLISG